MDDNLNSFWDAQTTPSSGKSFETPATQSIRLRPEPDGVFSRWTNRLGNAVSEIFPGLRVAAGKLTGEDTTYYQELGKKNRENLLNPPSVVIRDEGGKLKVNPEGLAYTEMLVGGFTGGGMKNLSSKMSLNTLKQLAGTTDAKVIRDTLIRTRELPPQSVEGVIGRLKSANTPEAVKGVIDSEIQKLVNESVKSKKAQTTIDKLTKALKEAEPVRAQQEELYSAERARRSFEVDAAGREVGGEAGYFEQLRRLKGPLPKAQYDAVRAKFNQEEIDSIFNIVEDARLLPLEKVSAKTGLAKLFDGAVPTNSEIALLREALPKELVDAVLTRRPLSARVFETLGRVFNIPRSIMASFDLSAPLRQGVFMVSRPKQFFPAFKSMFRYAFSEKSYDGLQESLKVRENYGKMRQSRLALTDLSENLTAREEQIMSSIPEKIPGLGKIIRGSNRAYTGFLNKLRADVFDDLVNKARITGKELSDVELDGIAKFINSATGRGSFGAADSLILPKSFEKIAPTLNAVFFSPRLMASRLNLLNPMFYVNLPPYARKEALKSLFAFTGIMGTILSVFNLLPEVEVGGDARSADFGKIKIDNTRYDVLGGFQQYVRLAAQLASGEIVSSTTGDVITLGEGYNPLTRKDILMRFFENKESPIASFVTGLLQGENAVGEKFDVPSEVISRFIPMVVQDIYELSQERGAEGILMGLPAVLGLGSQTYGTQELVQGVNKLGQPSVEIRPTQQLSTMIRDKVIGERPLETSQMFSIETYYEQLSNLPREEAAEIFDLIAEQNPALAKKISQVVKDKERGITGNDRILKGKGVASGDRALAVKKKLDKADSDIERANLWDELTSKGIITADVAKQLQYLYEQEEAPTEVSTTKTQ